jgi:hypothetical protein
VLGRNRRIARRTSRRVARRRALWSEHPPEAQGTADTTTSRRDDPPYIAELERPSDLRGKGVITEEEFEAKKRRLLDL